MRTPYADSAKTSTHPRRHHQNQPTSKKKTTNRQPLNCVNPSRPSFPKAQMAAILAPRRGKALSQALSAAAASPCPLSSFLPASSTAASSTWHSSARRPFSTTHARGSKLGRTPLSIPPGVEVLMGEPKTLRSATSYKPVVRKTITVKGPLGV